MYPSLVMNNFITHDWNGNAIVQLTVTTNISKVEIPASYVNATQMCKACGKEWKHYASLDGTKAYWEALSLEVGIPTSKLIIIIKGRGDKIEQGTWVHPEIAIDLAQWVSVQFRIWANRTLKRVIESELTASEPTSLVPTPQQISELYDLTLGKTNLDPKLVAGVKLNAISKLHPTLASAAELAKPALQVVVEDELLSPTQLAEMLSERTGEHWSNRKVNKLLLDQGFQQHNPDGGNNPAYLPTSKGEAYSKLILNTAKGRDKTIQSLRWLPTILEVLELGEE